MWGNRLGWSLSLVLVLIVVGSVYALNSYIEAVSARTAFSVDPNHGAIIELPISPSVVLPEMRDPADAGGIYRKALAEVRDHDVDYFKFLRVGHADDISSVPAINTLLEATTHSHATIFVDHPQEVINYNGDQPARTDLQTLGQCARRAGQLIAQDQPKRARDLYAAEFALGARLFEERLTYAELDAGLTLLAEGCGMLQTLPPTLLPSGFVDTARQFDTTRRAFVPERLDPMRNVIGSVDQNIVEAYAGDVFYFAQSAPERMWRVEAILKLGRYRFNAGRIGDQRSATRTLKKLEKDSDPIIQTAAKAALDLTVEQYRMIK